MVAFTQGLIIFCTRNQMKLCNAGVMRSLRDRERDKAVQYCIAVNAQKRESLFPQVKNWVSNAKCGVIHCVLVLYHYITVINNFTPPPLTLSQTTTLSWYKKKHQCQIGLMVKTPSWIITNLNFFFFKKKLR